LLGCSRFLRSQQATEHDRGGQCRQWPSKKIHHSQQHTLLSPESCVNFMMVVWPWVKGEIAQILRLQKRPAD
jgi:hypothetical protein